MTLEQIGISLGCTRERVRQLETKFWKRLQPNVRYRLFVRPFVAASLCDVMRKHGSLVMKIDSPDAPLRRFIARCTGIPEAVFPRTGIPIVGASRDDVMNFELIGEFSNMIDPHYIGSHLESFGRLRLVDSDLRTIAETVASSHHRSLTKEQKTYLALREIGKPAHYSKVTEVYNSMFPDDKVTEHNVHAVLNREKYGIVWIGIRGTFALKEWGAEHPTTTLFEVVAQIVQKKFDETGKPVAFQVITAEIGKYGQVVQLSSLVTATQYNLRLRRVFKDSFVPKDQADEAQEEISADELDKILRQFEKRYNR